MTTTTTFSPNVGEGAQPAEMLGASECRQRDHEAAPHYQKGSLERRPGTVRNELTVAFSLQTRYGISAAGTRWLLHRAPYRPPAVESYSLELPGHPGLVMQLASGWDEEHIDTAARAFIAECKQETATLWSHPEIKGRFKLRPPLVSSLRGEDARTEDC